MKRKHGDATKLFRPPQHAFCGASVQHERRQAWCCGLEPILESSGRRKVRLLPCLRFKKAFVGLKLIFESSMHFVGKCPA